MQNINRLVFLICMIFLASWAVPHKSIYDIKVKSIGGKEIDLAKYKGRKMLVATISGGEQDSALYRELNSFHIKNSTVCVIVVPSFEDGYQQEYKAGIEAKISKEDPGFIIAAPAYTKKASSTKQSVLMHWLTHKEKNSHFDNDVIAPGQKFFIDETGELFAVLDAKHSLSGSFVQRILSRAPLAALPVPATGNTKN